VVKSKFALTVGVTLIVFAAASYASSSNPPQATISVVPTYGVSANNVLSRQSSCTNNLWSCLNDAIGKQDGDTTYVYTTGSGNHTIGFSGYTGVTSITGATLHVIAKTTSGTINDTIRMSFFNNGSPAGTGALKTLDGNYTEYTSDFTNSIISDVNNITMKIEVANNSGTGEVRYTAAWIEVSYGGTGTSLNGLESLLSDFMGDQSLTDYIVGGCNDCAGGIPGAAVNVTTNAASPAVRNGNDSSSTKIVTSQGTATGSGTPAALQWVKKKPDTSPQGSFDSSTSVQGEWWVFVSSTTPLPRNLEFDLFWGDGLTGHTAMWGTHCAFQAAGGSGNWELDAQDGTTPAWRAAVDTATHAAIPCDTTLTRGGWHHILWQVHHDNPNASSPQIYYDYLTIDGVTHIVTAGSGTWGFKNSNNNWHTLGIQVQQDLNASHNTLTEYIDAMSVNFW